jgi:BirA family biotin operon repressor/biotin-[acetyl-CoA-carboxylase] ligase
VVDLTPEGLDRLLHTRWLGRTRRILDSCASTNDEVARLARAGHGEGLLVTAREQTAGRGRRGRDWHSPPGENLYASLLLRPSCSPDLVAPLTLLAGLALAEALVSLGFDPRVKWPNDLLLPTPAGPRKVAGMLMELSCQGTTLNHLVLGVGINVGTTVFPGELAEKATSLRLCHPRPPTRAMVLAAFLDGFEAEYEHFLAGGPGEGLARYRRFALLGQECFVEREGARLVGIAEDVDDSGALVLRQSDQNRLLVHAGEVNWTRPL